MIRQIFDGLYKMKPNYLLSISSVAILILTASYFLKFSNWNFDDSYIVYRIVNNILEGNGWVYNIDEPYNASTSILNTILIAVLSIVTSDIALSGHIIGGGGIFLAAIIFFQIYQRDFGVFLGLLGALYLIRLMSTNSTWGLETNLFIGLVFLFIFIERKSRRGAWCTLGFIILARPDGALLLIQKSAHEFLKNKVLPWQGLVIASLVILPWASYSLITFGQVFPETLGQKIWQGNSGYWGSGYVYLNGVIEKYANNASFVDWMNLVFLVPGILVLIKLKSPFLYFIIFCFMQQVAYILFNVPFYHWYYAMADIALSVSSLYTLGWLAEKIKIKEVFEATFLFKNISVSLAALLVVFWSYRLQSEREIDARDFVYTEIIKNIENKYDGKSLGVTEVGTIGFHSTKRIVDIVGLTSKSDQFVTQNRMNDFYNNPPELLLLHSPPWDLEHSIFLDSRFEKAYSLEEKFNEQPKPMSLFVRKSNYKRATSNHQTERFISAELRGINLKNVIDNSQKVSARAGRINGKIVPMIYQIRSNNIHQFKGWAINHSGQTSPSEVWIVLKLKEKYYFAEAVRFDRPDVALHFNHRGYLKSGFFLNARLHEIPFGNYSFNIGQRLSDGKIHLIDTGTKVLKVEN
jgi:hypothetical protein